MPGKITFHRFRTCERQFPVIGIAPRGIRPSDNLHLPSGILQPDDIQRLIQNPAGTGCQRRLVEIEVNALKFQNRRFSRSAPAIQNPFHHLIRLPDIA